MKTLLNRQAWVFSLLLIAVLCGVVAVRWWPPATSGEAAPQAPSSLKNESPVELTIDVGKGTPRAWSVPWQGNMTVQDSLAAAQDQMETGELSYSVKGRGAAAFLTELAGLPNEGPGGRNWQFEVNGRWSDRGLGVYELQPGDRLLWKFQASE